MKLNKKSWHAWFYKMLYGWDRKFPNNLCAYFWKMLLSIIVAPVLLLVCLPLYIEGLISKRDHHRDGYFHDAHIIASIFAWIGLFLIFSGVYVWFAGWESNWHIPAITLYGILAVIIIGLILNYYDEKRIKSPKNTHLVEKKPNVFIEFIKAKKNKYCPKIEWEE